MTEVYVERTPNNSQHTKLTREEKILPPLLPGSDLATFRSRVRRSNQQAIPVTPKHAYTLDPPKSEWADYAAVQAECGNLSGNEFKRNSSGNTRSQSSKLAEPLWTDRGLKSGTSLRELIST